MNRTLVAGGLSALVAGAAPAAAHAATLAVSPVKACYVSGDTVQVSGSGFTPGSPALVTLGDDQLGTLTPDASGNILGTLRLGTISGLRKLTLTATDQINPSVTGSLQLQGSGIRVRLKPRGGRAGVRRRVSAIGFQTGTTLYAHVVRRHFHRTIRIGTLHAPCGTLKGHVRLLRHHAHPGRYRVQFDTSPRYLPTTPVRVRFSLRVYRTVG